MKFIHILECNFHFDTFCFSFIVNRIVDHFFFGIQILDKSNDPIRFMILDPLFLCLSFICKYNRQFRIQVGCLMQSALDLFLFKSYLLENCRIRKKIDTGSGLFGLSDHRKKPILQFYHRNSSLITVVVDRTVTADLYIHISR